MEHNFLGLRHDDADDSSDDDDNGDDVADNDDSSLIVTMSIRRTLDDYRLVYKYIGCSCSWNNE